MRAWLRWALVGVDEGQDIEEDAEAFGLWLADTLLTHKRHLDNQFRKTETGRSRISKR